MSERTTIRRHPHRGVYDRAAIDAILDEALICHLGFVHDGQPYVIPTIHARADDVVYLHGSPASRMLQTTRRGVPVCLAVTLLDGLVLARSVYHHSMNYRSAVLLGEAREVVDAEEKLHALRAIVEHVLPGRWRDARRPTSKEAAGTMVLALPIDEASAKVRTGPPADDAADESLPVWAGVIPLRLVPGEPEPASAGVDLPDYVADYGRLPAA